jgi:hypothetical protein
MILTREMWLTSLDCQVQFNQDTIVFYFIISFEISQYIQFLNVNLNTRTHRVCVHGVRYVTYYQEKNSSMEADPVKIAKLLILTRVKWTFPDNVLCIYPEDKSVIRR